MKLIEFADANLRYESGAIAQDSELGQIIQNLLIELGLLAAIEDPFGLRAMAALNRFQRQHDIYEPEFLGPQTAAKLLEVAESGAQSRAPIMTLEAIQNTILKLRPLDSQSLEEPEKYSFSAGSTLELTDFEPERKHLKLTLSQDLQGSSVWYAFSEHVRTIGGEEVVIEPLPADEKPAIASTELPSTIKLDVPYKSQRDNDNNPDGSCNVTSLAMCLEFLGISRQRSSDGKQLEDELYEYALDNNFSRHSPHDLAQIVQDYGAKDAFDSHATIDAVKGWLAAGNPAVTHGYFTSFGHIVVLVGYDETGFLVHDPYGEWYSSGYDRNTPGSYDTKGQYLNYSYRLIEETCLTDNQFWVHFISK